MKKILISSVLLMLFAAPCAKAADIIGSFKVHAYQVKDSLALTDLVYLRNINDEQKKYLATVRIDGKQYPNSINSQQINKLLSDMTIKWKGKNKILAKKVNYQQIAYNDLLIQAQNCLDKELQQTQYQYKIQPLSTSSQSVTKLKQQQYQLTCKLSPELNEQQIPHKVAVSTQLIGINGQLIAEKTIWFTVEIKLPVYTAAHEIKAGNIITAKDLTKLSQWLPGLTKSFLQLQQQFSEESFIARKDIDKEQIVNPKLVKLQPHVSKNQMATLSLNKDDFEITIKVKAKQSGYINDVIAITVPSSDQVLLAKITGNGEVQIHEN